MRQQVQAALRGTNTPDRFVIEFEVVPEVFAQRISGVTRGFVHLPDDALGEAILPTLSILQLVDGDEQIVFPQGHDRVIAPGGIAERIAGQAVNVPGFQGIGRGGKSHNGKALAVEYAVHEDHNPTVCFLVVDHTWIIGAFQVWDWPFGIDIRIARKGRQTPGFQQTSGIVEMPDIDIQYADHLAIVGHRDVVVVRSTAAGKAFPGALQFRCNDGRRRGVNAVVAAQVG